VIGAALVSAPLSGDWVGPTFAALLAGALDYSAAGAMAVRDRLAVMGYYASTLGFSILTGWTAGLRAYVGDPQWQIVGAWAAGLIHLAMLCVFFGRPKRLAKPLGVHMKFASADSKAVKINGTLLGWTVAAAASAPLALGPMATLIDAVGLGTTHVWAAVISAINSLMTGGRTA